MTWRDFVDVDSVANACRHLSGQLPPLIVFAVLRFVTERFFAPGMLRSLLERLEEVVLVGIILLLAVDVLVPRIRRAINAIRHPLMAA
jgi:hypothetical protein